MKTLFLLFVLSIPAFAQVQGFVPVTQQMLENPSPNDWLMFSRTYDAQRFSPLKQVNKQNVSQLRMIWTRGLGAGQTEAIPLVHNGVMYLIEPGAIVQALQGDPVTLLFVGGHRGLLFLLGERSCARQARQGARHRAGEDEGADNALCRHWLSLQTLQMAPRPHRGLSILGAERD